MRDPVRAFTTPYRRTRFSTWSGERLKSKRNRLLPPPSPILHCAIVECSWQVRVPANCGGMISLVPSERANSIFRLWRGFPWVLSAQVSISSPPLSFSPYLCTFSTRFFHSFLFLFLFSFWNSQRQIVLVFVFVRSWILISSNEILFSSWGPGFDHDRFNIWNVPSGPEMMLELAVYYRYDTFWMSVGKRESTVSHARLLV